MNGISEINIENYKCFEKFSIYGFKQINIITGMNNIGKTALLEALYLSINSESSLHFLSCVSDIFSERGFYNNEYLKMSALFKEKNSINISTNLTSFKAEVINGSNLTIDDKENFLSLNNMKDKDFFSLQKQNFFKFVDINEKIDMGLFSRVEQMLNNLLDDGNYIGSLNTYISSKTKNSNFLKYSYERVTSLFKEDRLVESLKLIDNDIEKLNIISDMLQVKLKRISSYIPINELGDGFCKVAEVLMQLLISNKNSIIIDEIENGIHYSKIDIFWKDIITVCQANNIQLFTTTHSKEFIDKLNKICSELDFSDVALINLYKNKDEIKYTLIDNLDVLNNRIALELENR